MTKKILLDADALIALTKTDDLHYDKARDILKRISDEELFLVNTTLAEAVSALGRKVSRKASLKLLDYIRNQPLTVVYADEPLTELAGNFYQRQTSKKNTFFDCLNMAVARAYQIEKIFSFDRGYEQNGFGLLK